MGSPERKSAPAGQPRLPRRRTPQSAIARGVNYPARGVWARRGRRRVTHELRSGTGIYMYVPYVGTNTYSQTHSSFAGAQARSQAKRYSVLAKTCRRIRVKYRQRFNIPETLVARN